jgi:peptide/nickel transport system ATP-binding protein
VGRVQVQTTALDVTTQAQILELLRRLQHRHGMAVLFITHDFGVVAEIAHRVAVMEGGVLVEIGAADQVLTRPQHEYTRRLIAAVPHGRAKPAPGDAKPLTDGRTDSLDPTAAAAAPVLAVRGLSKTYRSGGWWAPRRAVAAVQDVSFTVQRGQTLGIVGESGSGKSTIGKCLLRLTDVDAGTIEFAGRDIVALPERELRPLRKYVQMVFQDPYASLNPRHTVGRIVADGPMAHGTPAPEAYQHARELLALVGLEPSAFERYPNQFSGGQRQRIGIARALALQPQVIVADESVSALDVSVQAQILQLLADLQRRLALALVFITHDLRVAAQICDQVLVMHRGRIVESGAPARVFAAPEHEYTRRLISSIPGQAWLKTT